MREKQIENKLASEVKKAGGIALKFVSPSFDGMPDRLVLIPDGHIAFVELKAPGKSHARSSWHDTGSFDRWAFGYMSSTA